jgi:hypothetical protein
MLAVVGTFCPQGLLTGRRARHRFARNLSGFTISDCRWRIDLDTLGAD